VSRIACLGSACAGCHCWLVQQCELPVKLATNSGNRFTWDSQGRRVEKKVDGDITRFYYSGQPATVGLRQVVEERDGRMRLRQRTPTAATSTSLAQWTVAAHVIQNREWLQNEQPQSRCCRNRGSTPNFVQTTTLAVLSSQLANRLHARCAAPRRRVPLLACPAVRITGKVCHLISHRLPFWYTTSQAPS